MTGGRGVHLLLQHPLVDGADRPLRAAVDLGARCVRRSGRCARRRAADPAADPLGPVGDLVVALALAPLLGPVGVADRHPADRDRVVDAGDRRHPGIRRPVRTITVPSMPSRISRFGEPTSSAPSGRDRRRLRARARPPASPPPPRSQTSFAVARRFPSERSKRSSSSVEADDLGVEHGQGGVEQLLAGLVAVEDDDPRSAQPGPSPVAAHFPALPAACRSSRRGRRAPATGAPAPPREVVDQLRGLFGASSSASARRRRSLVLGAGHGRVNSSATGSRCRGSDPRCRGSPETAPPRR